MAIATDMLQQNNAPALTDTLLLANSDAGTTQLSLAQAAAFFGAELVKAGNPVGAALSNKAAKSAQDTVEKTGASARTVELAASELPAFFNALPRLLTEDLIVKASGTLNEQLYLNRFYGSGSIWIEGSGGCTFQKGISVNVCSVGITLKNLEFSGHPETRDEIVLIQNSRYVSMQGCAVTGAASTPGSEDVGVRVNLSSAANLWNCGVRNCHISVMAGASSTVTLMNDQEGGFSGSSVGAYVSGGGIILLSGETPELLGGSANSKSGGLIVKKDGTLL